MAALNIADARFFSFSLPLKSPLHLGDAKFSQREGFVIRITNEQGNVGWGEISPLPGFSQENCNEITEACATLLSWLPGEQVPDGCEQLNGAFDHWLGQHSLPASVRFGAESAVLNLLAAAQQIPLQRLLSGSERQTVVVNALFTGSSAAILTRTEQVVREGYRAVKLKVGRQRLNDDMALTKQVWELLRDRADLRLDANRAWKLEEAMTFAEGIADCRIEYIEEPCKTMIELERFARDSHLPVALDESVLNMNPSALANFKFASAIILKPTLIGGPEQAARLARSAHRLGIKTVISSSYESSLGIGFLACFTAAVTDGETPAGLNTLSVFAHDLTLQPVRIINGSLSLSEISGPALEPDPQFMDEISCA